VKRLGVALRTLAAVAAAGALSCAGVEGAAGETAALPASPLASTRLGSRVSWVVGMSDSVHVRGLERALEGQGAIVERLPGLQALTVQGGRRSGLSQVLRAASGVDYVEPQLARHLLAEPADATDTATGRPFSWAFDAVRAGAGIARADGGAPDDPVAVVDTGVDATHPDLSGRIMAGYDVLGEGSVQDVVGHGTFVAGLISAIDGNGAGGRGVAGATPIIPVRVSAGTAITSADLAAGIVAAVDRGARVINLSIGGPGFSSVERTALEYARAKDVLVVASAGNSGEDGNFIEYPAAAIGGDRGEWSAGLSVAATDPAGRPAGFSSHNSNVSIAAPGAGAGPCTDGVYSTIPLGKASLWAGGPCDRIFTAHGPGRYAYAEGTSFSAPMVAGAAALVREIRPALRSEQVGDVLRRSARQTQGVGWNEYTGAGILDIDAATALAARYDATAPALSLTVNPVVAAVHVRLSADDRSAPGDEIAGGVIVGLDYSRDGVSFFPLLAPGSGVIDQAYAASLSEALWLRANACDRNRNCVHQTLGPLVGAPPVAATTMVTSARVRTSILAFGVGRSCRPIGRTCVRVVWRTGPLTGERYRYAVEVRQVGVSQPVARASGSSLVGRRIALNLTLRRPPTCGRIVVRLTTTRAAGAQVGIRRATVRTRCTHARKRHAAPHHQAP
jgi:subtilisin family serine protease